MLWEGLTEKMTFKQRLESNKQMKERLEEEHPRQRAKVLGEEYAWYVTGTARQPVWLEKN